MYSIVACADLKTNYSGATVRRCDGATVRSGDLVPFPDAAIIVVGSVDLLRSNGATVARLSVSDLPAETTFGAHVHDLPCNVRTGVGGLGGGHYKLDPSVEGTDEANEMWLTLSTDIDGNASSEIIAEGHTARPEAQSVVVHDPQDASIRLACADLQAQEMQDEAMTSGNPFTTATGKALGHKLRGSATMLRTDDGFTEVNINIISLKKDAAVTYSSHVHNLPCKVDGGGHYKIDATLANGVETNEIWPKIVADAFGHGHGSAAVALIARAEAQSVVMHDADGTRLACFDLD